MKVSILALLAAIGFFSAGIAQAGTVEATAATASGAAVVVTVNVASLAQPIVVVVPSKTQIGPAGEQLVSMSSLSADNGECELIAKYLGSDEMIIQLTYACPAGHFNIMQTDEQSGEIVVTTQKIGEIPSEVNRLYRWNMKPWYKRIVGL